MPAATQPDPRMAPDEPDVAAVEQPTHDLSGRAVAIGAAVLFGVTALVGGVSLTLSPTVWVDEVMIVDYGRCLFEPSSEWSVSVTPSGRPVLPIAPVYCGLQQLWLRLWGATSAAARSFSYISAMACAYALYELLRQRGGSRSLSAALSAAWFVDPLFVRSYFGGRADAFALALAFGALALWRAALARGSGRCAAASGAGAVAAVFSWPTVATTLLLAITDYLADVARSRAIRLRVVLTAIAGAAMAVVPALVYWHVFSDQFRSLGRLVADDHFAVLTWSTLLDVVVSAYQRSPWIPPFLVAAILFGLARRRALAATIALAAAFLPSLVVHHWYGWRLLYITPLAYLAAADALSGLPRSATRWVLAALVCSVGLAWGINVGARTYVAQREKARRDYDEFGRQLTALVPPGAVVVGDHSAYFIGLRQQWRMFVSGFESGHAQHYDEVFAITKRRRSPNEDSAWAESFDCQWIGATSLPGPKTVAGAAAGYDRHVYRCTRSHQPGMPDP